MEWLTEDTYLQNAQRHGPDHALWSSAAQRWHYHEHAVSIAKKLGIANPGQVLEAGSIGAQILQHSDTMDIENSVWPCADNPTYNHDMRLIPWPVFGNRYRLFIALRVWHHLGAQKEDALSEALRVARYVMIGLPGEYDDAHLIQHASRQGARLMHNTLCEGGTTCRILLWAR
jgi:hypothetical protein